MSRSIVRRKKSSRRKKSRNSGCMPRAFVSIIIVALILLLFGLMIYKGQLKPVDKNSAETELFTVTTDDYTSSIAAELNERDLIRSKSAFKMYCRLHHIDSALQAGTYRLSSSMSVKEITEALTSGDVVLSSFTVVEGSSLKQIADVVAENTKVTADEFLWQAYKNNYVSDYNFLSGIPDGQYNSLEGYLYPDTYYVDPENVSADTIIREMLDRFAEVEQELQLEQKASALNLSLHELLTVASLIEDEAKIESERPVIAQVVYNRLAENMPLQFCSSVIYAWGGDLTEVLNEHLEIDSPYNTYINTGLPPGPISSPGYNSLNAAANPDTSCDYLFFVANDVTGDGSHVFARTFEEHEKNIAQYQR